MKLRIPFNIPEALFVRMAAAPKEKKRGVVARMARVLAEEFMTYEEFCARMEERAKRPIEPDEVLTPEESVKRVRDYASFSELQDAYSRACATRLIAQARVRAGTAAPGDEWFLR